MLQTQVPVPDTVEAKQTETLAFGEDKGLLQGQPNEENGWLMLRKPKLPDYLHGEFLNGKIWGEGRRVCDFILISW